MAKKIISLFLIAVMLFTLSCCGKNEDEDNSGVYNPDTVTTQGNTENDSTQSTSDAVKITVPEGYTALKIAWLLEENGICGTDEFIDALQNYDTSSREILASLGGAENVCFKLEGYLFPATYTFKKGTEPVKVIDKMLDAFENNFGADMTARAAELGLSVHEVLTIASIIEKEAFTPEQRGLVSSTIHNRLKQKMRLEYDVTVKYCTGVIQVYYPDKIDFYKFYYNGNRKDGIIAGPICNPGMNSIKAALYPDDTDYLFFVIDTEEPHHHAFASTYSEHLKNVEKWKAGEL